MKPCPALLFALVVLAGCATPSITVLSKKDTSRPYSRLLVVYIDGAIDLSLFDSTTYNICLRSCFLDTAGLDTRNSVESLLSDNLSAPRSLFLKSADLFDPDRSSYAYFNRQLDSLGIEAIFLVSHSHYHTVLSDTLPNYDLGHPARGSIISHRIANGVFTYYLIEPHHYLPVWKAELIIPGKRVANGKPPMIFMEKLEKSLVEGGYIVPHHPIRTSGSSADR